MRNNSKPAEVAVTRTCILVVEDELLIRLCVADSLRDAGYDVVEAASGNEAAVLLEAGAHVDLVFSDVRMPGSIDGLALLKIVRQRSPGLPVVICSGHLEPGIALACGATGFIPKPYEFSEVVSLIESELAER
jgi:CheY-like chemotaxis protein